MTDCRGVQFSFALLIMAAFTGLMGFIVVYHYATHERPTQYYAIVIDAGSTQTRSSLFSIELDTGSLTSWWNGAEDQGSHLPLTKLFQVKQVGACVNGDPLASLQSELGAKQLIGRCLFEFAHQIKGLKFEDVDSEEEANSVIDGHTVTKEMVVDKMAAIDHRVDSVTHLYLGATAGMRALSKLNATRASEKIQWIDRAINESNLFIGQAPTINKGFVGIISGAQEASFGWASVNFMCETLEAQLASSNQLDLAPSELPEHSVYKLSDDSTSQQAETSTNSIGTIELGGASAQMAFEAATNKSLIDDGFNLSQMNLFNGRYQLASRSDLCLGMSQAILRVNYILLSDHLVAANGTNHTTTINNLELINPCLQNGAKVSLSGVHLADVLQSPCLAAADGSDDFRRKVGALSSNWTLMGTGNTEQCDKLLAKLIEPPECKQYFALCPKGEISGAPPKGMPFVTISGYNKALRVLDLQQKPLTGRMSDLELSVAEKLGGFPVDHEQFSLKMREFCAVPVGNLSDKYPKLNYAFHNVNCLQLVYIKKLLTEFYHFKPDDGSWLQVKFLLFPAQDGEQEASNRSEDIGWTLGLLLNATSHRMSGGGDDLDPDGAHLPIVWYHHGASVACVLRVTLFLMFACLLLALSIIVAAVFGIKRKQRKAYISHHRSALYPRRNEWEESSSAWTSHQLHP